MVTKIPKGKTVEGMINITDAFGNELDAQLIKSVSISRPIAKIEHDKNSVSVLGLELGLTTLKFRFKDGSIISHRIRIV